MIKKTVRSTAPFLANPYTIDALVRVNTLGGYKAMWDKARVERQAPGGKVYRLKKLDRETRPIPETAVDRLENGEIMLNLVENDNDELVALKISQEDLPSDRSGVEQSNTSYRLWRYRSARHFWKKKSWYELFKAEIMIIVFSIAFLLFSWVGADWFAQSVTPVNEAAESMQQAARAMAEAQKG